MEEDQRVLSCPCLQSTSQQGNSASRVKSVIVCPLLSAKKTKVGLKNGDEMNKSSEDKCEDDDSMDDFVPLSLFDIAWEDILFSNLLPYLNWKELFRLGQVSWQGRRMVHEYFAKLKNINLTDVPITLNAFQTLTQDCTNIRKLILRDSLWIRDKELSHIFNNNAKLTHLDLTNCPHLTGSCLLTLAVRCRKLTTLILRDCHWLTKGAMETLMSHQRLLEEVDLSSCSALSTQLLIHFVQRFPLLKKLHLAYIQTVNDATLGAIARSCRGLTLLDIQACMGVTDHGIRSIAEYCTKLESISVANCHLVTEYSLRLLRNRDVLVDVEISNNADEPYEQVLMVVL